MLSASERELVCRGIDGDLAPADAARLRRLLAESAEALALYRALAGHSRRLKGVRPAPAPPQLADLAPRVMARVRALPPPPVVVPSARPVQRGALPLWVPGVVAASVLLAFAVGRFGADPAPEVPAKPLATAPPKPAPSLARATPPPLPVPRELAPEPREFAPEPTRLAEVLPAPHAVRELAPEPREFAETVVGAASVPAAGPLAVVAARLPALLAVAELGSPEWQRQLGRDFAREPVYRVDLFARDALKASEQLQAALRSGGAALYGDAAAQDRLRRKQAAGFAVYSETLSPADVLAALGALGKSAPAEPRGVSSAHVYPAGAADLRELRDTAGLDRPWWKRARVAPTPATTAGQIAAQLDKSPKLALFTPVAPSGARVATPADAQAFWGRHDAGRAPGFAVLVTIRVAP